MELNTVPKQTDLQAALEIRGAVYDLLRRFFIEEPSHAYLKECLAFRVFETFPLEQQSPEIARGLRQIRDYLQQYDLIRDKAAFEQLHWDYTRMFIGPLSLPAPPWASYYLEKDKLLFQKTTLQIRILYQKYGFVAGEHINSEADDHVGYELDFIYRLNQICLQKSARLQVPADLYENLLDQKNLIAGHMNAFVPAFTQAVAKAAATLFYKGMAQILCGYLQLDVELLNALLADIAMESDAEIN